MKYECKSCNYTTANKANFNKHTASNKHKTNVEILASISFKASTYVEEIENELNCECGSTFAHSSSLSRHKKQCEARRKISFLEGQVATLEKINDKLMLNTNTYGSIINKTNINYNISVKNYVQQNYADAPHLKEFRKFSAIEEPNVELYDTLINAFEKHTLHKYLGNILITAYKKTNPNQQSMWNSDVTRLTYFVKELLNNKKSNWTEDKNAEKTKDYLINPMLVHIRSNLNTYIINTTDLLNARKIIDTKGTTNHKMEICNNIISEIDDQKLSTSIIRYITPHFYLTYKVKENRIIEFSDDKKDNEK